KLLTASLPRRDRGSRERPRLLEHLENVLDYGSGRFFTIHRSSKSLKRYWMAPPGVVSCGAASPWMIVTSVPSGTRATATALRSPHFGSRASWFLTSGTVGISLASCGEVHHL